LAQIFQHIAQTVVCLAQAIDRPLGIFDDFARHRRVARRDIAAREIQRRPYGAKILGRFATASLSISSDISTVGVSFVSMRTT